MVCEHLVAGLMDGLLNKLATIFFSAVIELSHPGVFLSLRLLMASFVPQG